MSYQFILVVPWDPQKRKKKKERKSNNNNLSLAPRFFPEWLSWQQETATVFFRILGPWQFTWVSVPQLLCMHRHMDTRIHARIEGRISDSCQDSSGWHRTSTNLLALHLLCTAGNSNDPSGSIACWHCVAPAVEEGGGTQQAQRVMSALGCLNLSSLTGFSLSVLAMLQFNHFHQECTW